jgi:hypothetical protein
VLSGIDARDTAGHSVSGAGVVLKGVDADDLAGSFVSKRRRTQRRWAR